MRLVTSADEPRGGIFTTLYSWDGEAAACTGECVVFDPFDTMEFRLLCRDVRITNVTSDVEQLTEARDELPEAELSVLPVRRLPDLNGGLKSPTMAFLFPAGESGADAPIGLGFASSCLKKF